jgi:argininosuccinate lyase
MVKKSKLWQKSIEVDKKIENFTIGKDRELDLLLARYDIIGSLAHIAMLQSIGLISQDELSELNTELRSIYRKVEAGDFRIEEGVEDVHSQVELLLTATLGEKGKKIHAGRSRNDQVLLDLKLFMRQKVEKTVGAVHSLFERLIKLSDKYQNYLMPGYTHMQVAMPSSFGLWFGAFAESLADDLAILKSAFEVINRNPLGSAAGYGSSFPLDRQMTSDLLGFESMNYNVVYAQMGRGKAEKILANAFATIADTIGRLAMDITLYIGQDYQFFHFPEELTTGSSIMPHKKNPDVFELIRARCNKIKALPNEIALITTNLPTGYHRDLQMIKESVLPACDDLVDCLEIMEFAIEHIRVNEDILQNKKYDYLFTVELVNRLVMEGMPFRDAYAEVGKKIEDGNFKPDKELKHTHTGSIGNLSNDKISKRFGTTLEWFDERFARIKLRLADLAKVV